jgi:hypothetical protein
MGTSVTGIQKIQRARSRAAAAQMKIADCLICRLPGHFINQDVQKCPSYRSQPAP